MGEDVKAVFEKAKSAVVRITADDFHGSLVGTGFFINPSGTVFTAYSVAGESWNVVVEFGEKKFPAVRLVADERSGLAVLKIAGTGTPFIPLGKPSELVVASAIMSIGYPMDLPVAPNVGFLAGFDQKYLGGYLSTTHLRANIPVHRGEQGSPILNLKGEAVGVLVARMDDGKGTCYALPIHAARKVFHDYERFGVPRPGWVGVNVKATGAFDAEGSEAVVRLLEEDSPAAKAGIKEGDVILGVGDLKFKRPSDMIDASFFLTGGETIPITLRRGEQILTLNVLAIDNPIVPPPNQLNELLELDRYHYFMQLEREQYAEGEPAPSVPASTPKLKLNATTP